MVGIILSTVDSMRAEDMEGGALKLHLQVDMGGVRFLCGVATQRIPRVSAWATSYKLQLSTDGITWNTYKETNVEKVRRELYVIDVFRSKEFEVNANN